ncbi:hypothetical protein E2C01_028220 [Portunus trituberculatus]|uniref:Uncharacterized protein n=1 Tax=Portunus trituberculatus TaxID=210409 RepID=A0A5B7ENG6_PORTR|nr:hypothetical protein [Portunus trituberculatus]
MVCAGEGAISIISSTFSFPILSLIPSSVSPVLSTPPSSSRDILSTPSPLTTCPRYPSCLLTTVINYLVAPVICNTSWLVLLATHGTLIILLMNHKSAISSLFFISVLTVQVSQPYITDQI